MATASQRNPNTDPDDLVDDFSNCMGGTCTGGGGGGEGVAFSGKGATFTGLPAWGLTLGASEGLGARGGVMNTVYLPALPITGGGGGASRGSAAAMAVADEEEEQEKEEGPRQGDGREICGAAVRATGEEEEEEEPVGTLEPSPLLE